MTESPMYLTRGGVIALLAGSLRFAGEVMNTWARTAFSMHDYVYYMGVSNTAVRSSNSGDRWGGFAVRK